MRPNPPAMALQCSPLWPLTPRTERVEIPSSVQPAGAECKAQHGLQHFRIGRFTPRHAADFRVDIGGHERGDGGMMTGQAKSEIVLQLLGVVEIGPANILPACQDAEEPIRRSAHFDQPARLRRRHTSLEKRRGVVNLG